VTAAGPVVRPMVADDIPAAVALHQRELGAEFITGLGPGFLRAYYRAWLASPAGICFVAEVAAGPPVPRAAVAAAGPAGLLLGSTDPQAHYRSMLRRHGAVLGLSLVLEALRHPSRGVTLARTRGIRYARALARSLWRAAPLRRRLEPGAAAAVSVPAGEITHVAVDAAHRRAGVGRALMAGAEAALAAAGVARAELVTPLGEQAARAFYEALGWAAVAELRSRSGEAFVLFTKAMAPAGGGRAGPA
jgi:ribosomal protein S18 acetylase RimI-like enzyme